MKYAYLDTNILLTLLRHQDPNYKLVSNISQQKHIHFVTGAITVVEFYSVLSREEDLLHDSFKQLLKEEKVEKLLTLPLDKQIHLLFDYLSKIFSLSILDEIFMSFQTKDRSRYRTSPIYKLAMKQSSTVKLRTLDNLHLATARFYDEFTDIAIHYLITIDQNFLNKREICQSLSSMLLVHPQTFNQLECL